MSNLKIIFLRFWIKALCLHNQTKYVACFLVFYVVPDCFKEIYLLLKIGNFCIFQVDFIYVGCNLFKLGRHPFHQKITFRLSKSCLVY
jgi:hypothetical protein